MLKKFSVTNFKGFRDTITVDLGSPSNYNFNSEVIENDIVTKGIIYGINNCGKSNLGLAIFDISAHLTDNQVLSQSYNYYLNLGGEKPFAKFEYIFKFDEHEVVYRYCKKDIENLVLESLLIDGKEVLFFDFTKNDGFTLLEGSDTLNDSIKNKSSISRVKYVYKNSILVNSEQNLVFKRFISFVERMLLFYSLDSRGYEGFKSGIESISDGIIESGKLQDFQEFLQENEIYYQLYERELDDKKAIYCRFMNRGVNLFSVASTGTKSLTLFYYWYIKMKQASFVYIDEYDAFYHFKLSESVQKRLKEILGVQIFTTTHNTDIISNDLLRPDCYFLLDNGKFKAFADLTEKELRQAHNLQKMFKAGAFNVK